MLYPTGMNGINNFLITLSAIRLQLGAPFNWPTQGSATPLRAVSNSAHRGVAAVMPRRGARFKKPAFHSIGGLFFLHRLRMYKHMGALLIAHHFPVYGNSFDAAFCIS